MADKVDPKTASTKDAVDSPVFEEQWKYEDPHKDDPPKGMLLSDEIDWFCRRGLLIGNSSKEAGKYDAEHLRPAAYTLRIGKAYVDSRGKEKRLSKKNPSFYIEPNSIAFVSTYEELNLPFYIAARFNLRVKWVYKGILLGTGPQVEPGYEGFLSCPLYNLTATPIKVTLHEEFASIDFERTSPFCPGMDWKSIREQRNTPSANSKLNQIIVGDRQFLLVKKEFYRPLKLLPEWVVVSSLMALSNEVKMWRNIGIGIAIAFVSLTLSLLGSQSNSYRDLRSLDMRVAQLESALKGLADKAAREQVPAQAPAAKNEPSTKKPGPALEVPPPAKKNEPSTQKRSSTVTTPPTVKK